jgi:hypothetical protein
VGVAENGEVAHGAGMDQMETGLISEKKIQLGVGGGVAEGHGESVEVGEGGVAGLHVGIEGAHLDGGGAAKTPVGGDHLFDEGELDFIDGQEAGDVRGSDGFEGVAVFVAQAQGFGKQAVRHGVLRGDRLAFGGDGSVRQGTIGTGSLTFLFRCNKHVIGGWPGYTSRRRALEGGLRAPLNGGPPECRGKHPLLS